MVEGLAEDQTLRREQCEGGLSRGGELLFVHALLGRLLGLGLDEARGRLGHHQLPREGGRRRVICGGGVVTEAISRRELEAELPPGLDCHRRALVRQGRGDDEIARLGYE